MRNPYTPMSAEDTVAQGNFVGRRDIWFHDLNARISPRGRRGRHLLIQGRSGAGKTSLLHQIAHQAINGLGVPAANVLYLDLGEPGLEPLDVPSRIAAVLPMGTRGHWQAGLSGLMVRVGRSLTVEAPVVGGPAIRVGELLPGDSTETIASAFGLVRARLDDLAARSRTLVILDQLGVAAESAERGLTGDRWRQVLQGVGRLLGDSHSLRGDGSVIFVMSVRMERTGALLSVAREVLFSADVDFIDCLAGLSTDEASELIIAPAKREGVTYSSGTMELLLQRARYTSFGLPGDIAGTSPLGLQLACWSLWEWLRHEQRLAPGSAMSVSAAEMDSAFDQVLGARLAGFSRDERVVLQVIAQNGALERERLVEMTEAEGVENPTSVIEALCRHGLQPVRHVRQGNFYAIAHDLLREYLIRSIPPEEFQLLRARRLLEDGARRVRANSPFSAGELGELWEWRDHLAPTASQLHAVLQSEALHGLLGGMERWTRALPEAAGLALIELAGSAVRADVRRQAAECLVSIGQREDGIGALRELARRAGDEGVRRRAAERLVELGERDEGIAVLSELAQSAEDERQRLIAELSVGRFARGGGPPGPSIP